MKNKIRKGKKIILFGICLIVIIVYCIYNFVLNPRDVYGNRCHTFYNQNQYQLVNGDTINIPNNSCFVSECCEYVATFRSKMKVEDLQNDLKILENKLNAKYTNLEFEIKVSEEKMFNTFTINYHHKE